MKNIALRTAVFAVLAPAIFNITMYTSIGIEYVITLVQTHIWGSTSQFTFDIENVIVTGVFLAVILYILLTWSLWVLYRNFRARLLSGSIFSFVAVLSLISYTLLVWFIAFTINLPDRNPNYDVVFVCPENLSSDAERVDHMKEFLLIYRDLYPSSTLYELTSARMAILEENKCVKTLKNTDFDGQIMVSAIKELGFSYSSTTDDLQSSN